MVQTLHGPWVYVGFSAGGLILCIWVDALRHLTVSWVAYFGWYRTLSRADRVFSVPGLSGGVVRLSDILDRPVADAPENVKSRYRANMAWFLAEIAASAVVFVGLFAVTGTFA